MAKENLDNDNPRREVFKKNSNFSNLLSKYDQNNDGVLNAEEVKSVKDLTLDSSSGVDSLEDLFNFPTLRELTLDNISLKNLSGLENCPQLNYLCFKNYYNESSENKKIGDYSALSKTTNLKYLYLVSTGNYQVETVFSKMENVDYGNLQYLGVYDSTTAVTDISSLENLTKITKEAVRYLYLYNNNLSSLSPIQDFTMVYELQVNNNSTLKTLDGLQKWNGLSNLNASNCDLGLNENYDVNVEGFGKNEETDALSFLSGKTSIISLNLRNNKNLKWIDYIVSLGDFEQLFLDGCESLTVESVRLIKDKYLAVPLTYKKSIDSKYLGLFNTDDKIDYAELNLTNSSDQIKNLYGNTTVKALRLDNNSLLTDNVTNERKLTETLATCTNLEVLSLRNITGISNIDFVKNMKNLKELDLIGCSNINDLSPLETNKVYPKCLRLDNPNINLTNIQTVISKLSGNNPDNTFMSSPYTCWGFYTENLILLKKLGSCSKITNLSLGGVLGGTSDLGDLDLSGCTSLTKVVNYYCKVRMIFPSSLLTLDFGDKPCAKGTDFSKCNKISSVRLAPEYGGLELPSLVENLKSCTSLETLKIERVVQRGDGMTLDFSLYTGFTKLTNMTLWTENYKKCEKISVIGLGNLTSLQDLSIRGLGGFTDLSGFENLKSLTSLTLESCGIFNISNLSGLTGLATLKLKDNKISSLKPLENMRLLSYLDLSNNAITDDSSYLEDGESLVRFKNLEIIKNLNTSNGGQLSQVFLAGNPIADYSLIKDLPWTESSF